MKHILSYEVSAVLFHLPKQVFSFNRGEINPLLLFDLSLQNKIYITGTVTLLASVDSDRLTDHRGFQHDIHIKSQMDEKIII